jgi:hypothetical protein
MLRMRSTQNPSPPRHLHASDLRALALLVTEATAGITSVAEGVHQSVWRTLGVPGGANKDQTRGLTGLVYQGVHGATQWVGRGVTGALVRLEPLLQKMEGQTEESAQRTAVVAALNGVIGDRLMASNNPLAMSMTLRCQNKILQWASPPVAMDVSGKVLIVIHGLCMNDQQWTAQHGGQTVNHATSLAQALGYTPVYLRYNTGLHVSDNGLTLAEQLEELLQHWPMPLTDISVLSHSMGGLVIRSAMQQASSERLNWPKHLKNIVFLGTPHHGAPLERAGSWVDAILGSMPYSRPFAKLGQLRSAGITDLRYGHVLNGDWHGHDRFQSQPDRRTPVPLPDGVSCFTVAATTAPKRSHLADRLVGDGLVPLLSALGQHDAPARCLQFAPEHQLVVYQTSHLALLSSHRVKDQLLQWLA